MPKTHTFYTSVQSDQFDKVDEIVYGFMDQSGYGLPFSNSVEGATDMVREEWRDRVTIVKVTVEAAE